MFTRTHSPAALTFGTTSFPFFSHDAVFDFLCFPRMNDWQVLISGGRAETIVIKMVVGIYWL